MKKAKLLNDSPTLCRFPRDWEPNTPVPPTPSCGSIPENRTYIIICLKNMSSKLKA